MMTCESTGKTPGQDQESHQEAQARVGFKKVVRQSRVQDVFNIYE